MGGITETSATVAAAKLAGSFLEWDLIEDEKAKLAERSKDLFKDLKDGGFDPKAARVTFREKRIELLASPEDVAKAEENEQIVDLYRAALTSGLKARAHPAPAHEKTLNNSASYAEATGREPVDREARAKRRTSEAMDDNKAFSQELLDAGLITPEAHAENIAISDGVARKYGAGVIDAETGEIREPVQEMHELPEGEATATGSDGDGTPAATNTPAESVSDEISAPISHQQPSSSPDADKAEAVLGSPTVSAPTSALVAQRIEQEVPNLSVAGSNPAERPTDDFDPSKLSFLSEKPRKPYRDGCRHPEPGQCASGGPGLCHGCKKAMAESEAA